MGDVSNEQQFDDRSSEAVGAINKTGAPDELSIERWQSRLVPWFIIMPTALIAVFIFLATRQMTKFNSALMVKPDVSIGQVSEHVVSNADDMRWITLVRLEQESYYRRYNQGSLLLMSRIYKQYLGFFTGMILSIVGAIFIIGKLREKTSRIDFAAESKLKASLASSSPGIIFGALGTVLMLTTMVSHNEVVVEDSPLYLNANAIVALHLLDAPESANNPLDQNAILSLFKDQEMEIQKRDSLTKRK